MKNKKGNTEILDIEFSMQHVGVEYKEMKNEKGNTEILDIEFSM